MKPGESFLPAAGRDVFLPLCDPMVSLMGGARHERSWSNRRIFNQTSVLDLGCGTGTLVVLLKRKYPTAEIVGVDPDPKALQRAQKKVRRASVAVQLDEGFAADELPYEAGTFDRVLSSFMLHHLEEHEREKTLREVLRVLKPAGMFHLLDFAGGEDKAGVLYNI